MFRLIETLKARGIGVVYVSHILEDCLEIGDRITILRDGRRVTMLRRGEPTVDELVQLMTGRSFSERYPHITSRPGKVALDVRGLSQAGFFRDVSFDVREGEIVGFWGLVGAGRTDVMEAVFGLKAPEAGEIEVFDWLMIQWHHVFENAHKLQTMIQEAMTRTHRMVWNLGAWEAWARKGIQ